MKKSVLITGGAGFIGAHASRFYIEKGWDVVILDNLERAGTLENLDWLRAFGSYRLVEGDIADTRTIRRAFSLCGSRLEMILHLAAQVAVTTSVENPIQDFRSNAWGTLNLLEGARRQKKKPIVIFASTNKVYGGLEEVGVVKRNGRYAFRKQPQGISEKQHLDFHSPYGCSKGAADQYVFDYSRIYNLPTIVMRQSCIYGTRQWGMEDQGWIAHFAICAVLGLPITIYGDGRQIRDVLHIEDLIRAYEMARQKIHRVKRKVYNIGGGPRNTLSLLETIQILEKRLGLKMRLDFKGWRPGDQKVYVSDVRKARRELNWTPKMPIQRGVSEMVQWIVDHRQLVQNIKRLQVKKSRVLERKSHSIGSFVVPA